MTVASIVQTLPQYFQSIITTPHLISYMVPPQQEEVPLPPISWHEKLQHSLTSSPPFERFQLFNKFPYHLQAKILSFLEYQDVKRVKLVNRHMKGLVDKYKTQMAKQRIKIFNLHCSISPHGFIKLVKDGSNLQQSFDFYLPSESEFSDMEMAMNGSPIHRMSSFLFGCLNSRDVDQFVISVMDLSDDLLNLLDRVLRMSGTTVNSLIFHHCSFINVSPHIFLRFLINRNPKTLVMADIFDCCNGHFDENFIHFVLNIEEHVELRLLFDRYKGTQKMELSPLCFMLRGRCKSFVVDDSMLINNYTFDNLLKAMAESPTKRQGVVYTSVNPPLFLGLLNHRTIVDPFNLSIILQASIFMFYQRPLWKFNFYSPQQIFYVPV